MKLSKAVTALALANVVALSRSVSARAGAKDVEPQVIEIHAKKFGYQPEQITLRKGETNKLHLTSDDVPHSLRIKQLDLNAKMKAGEFDDVLFTPEQVGDFTADCGLYCGAGHKKMSMTVQVVGK
ncbi:MAG: cupredoxin domain-containing protein [Acidobacteriaceae bacterium]